MSGKDWRGRNRESICAGKDCIASTSREWKKSMEGGLESGGGSLTAVNRSAWAADKKKIKELERDLHRKDRALAETTALLVLKKKADLIWGSGENE